MRPVTIAVAVAELGAVVAPGFDSTAEHPAEVCAPGCSGNVVPGAPGSAAAGAAAIARAATARAALMRFIADPSNRDAALPSFAQLCGRRTAISTGCRSALYLALTPRRGDTGWAVSQENADVVRLAYEALARGGLDRFMEHFTDDVDYRAVSGAPDDIGPIHGKNAFRAWLKDWFDMFDGFKMELLELIDAGEETVVWVERFGGRARRSGIQIDLVIGGVFTIRDGKLARGREYATREQALEAAGLRE